MAPQERIQQLEESLAHLSREKSVALNALEKAAELGSFKTRFGEISQPMDIIREAADKVSALIDFKGFAFYLVDEDDSDFHMVLCSDEAWEPFIENETEHFIEDTIFSWVLGRNKPFTMGSHDHSETLLLHAITTPARTRGMFVGVLASSRGEILDVSLSLTTILLLFTATLLESHETYAYINDINKELRSNITRLAESENQLIRHRDNLEAEVASRTAELTRINEQLSAAIQEHQKTQEELRKERDFISAILNTAGALLLVLDHKGRIVRMNRAMEDLTGHLLEQVQGSYLWDTLLASDGPEGSHTWFEDLRPDDFPLSVENVLRSASGSRRRISWSNTAITGPDGAIEFIVASGLDITEHRSAEIALRNSEAKFRAVFTDAGMGIAIGSRHGRILDFNPMFERMFSRNRAELLNTPLNALIHPQDAEEIEVQLDSILSGYRSSLSLEQRFLLPSDATLWGRMTITPVSDASVGVQYFIIMIEDVTEARRMENQLREAEETYRNIFEHAVEGVFQGYLRGRFIKANPALARILGVETPQELLRGGVVVSELLCSEASLTHDLEETLREKGEVSNFELQSHHADGRRIWLSLSARVVAPAAGSEGPLIEGLVDDVTNAKLATLQLKHQATIDELTRIPNRYLFLERLEHMVDQAARTKTGLSLLYLDLDNFKDINDNHGHHIGDIVLKQAADRISARIRHSDLVARLGGDEFTILLQHVSSDEDVRRVALNIIGSVGKPYNVEGIKCFLGASIGVSRFPDHGTTPEELLKAADSAMYRAKHEGGDTVVFFDNTLGNEEAEPSKPVRPSVDDKDLVD